MADSKLFVDTAVAEFDSLVSMVADVGRKLDKKDASPPKKGDKLKARHPTTNQLEEGTITGFSDDRIIVKFKDGKEGSVYEEDIGK